MSSHKFVFGYGSLVNLATHCFDANTFTKLHGFERVWIASETRAHAYLSIRPQENSAIEGAILYVPEQDFDNLNAREKGYQLIDVSAQIDANPSPTFTYLREEIQDEPAPILFSYLATVLDGFFQFGSEDAAHAFLDSTKNWGPLLHDEDDPLYPRYAVDDARSSRIKALILEFTSQL